MNTKNMKNTKSNPKELYYSAQADEETLFNYAAKLNLPVLIKGPTGCGKTRFIEYMGQKLNRKVYTIACHDDLTAADLVGRYLIGDKETYWQDGPLTKAVREGGICYLDEVVEARKDTTVVIHPLADYRRILPIDKTGEMIEAHPDFMLVLSYNPGYQNLLKGMKPSTKQRFIAMSFDYPSMEKEAEIIIKEASVEPELAKKLAQIGQEIRRLSDIDIEESISTRLLIYTALLIKQGLTAKSACRYCLIETITDDKDTILALEELINLQF